MKERKKILFLVILIYCAVFLSIVFSFFVFNKLRIERNEIINNMKTLGGVERKIANSKDNEKMFYNLKEEKEEIGKIIIVNQENFAAFIEYLELLASSSSVNASFESIQESQAKENYNFILNVKADGSFNDIYHFINLLENIPYLISVDNLILVKKGKLTEEDKNYQSEWEARMNLKILAFDKLK